MSRQGEWGAEREIESQRGGIRLVAHAAHQAQGTELAGEVDDTVARGVIERLLAHAVARQDQLAAPRVPQRQREHAFHVPEKLRSVLLVEVDQHLDVGASAEAMSLLEIAPQRRCVVDLPVAYQAQRARLVRERLAAVLQVDDRETPATERDRPAREDTAFVRTAVTERLRHPLEQFLAGRHGTERREPAEDPTHERTLGLFRRRRSRNPP
jgi:hypothetical protein